MRVGLDVSALGVSPTPGLARLVDGIERAVTALGRVELVRLEPAPGPLSRGRLRAWRQLELPRRARELALDGVHSPVSAFAWRGPGWRVQTLHELPWLHGVRENADLAHRVWARLGALAAQRVVCASERVASELRARVWPGAGKLRVVPWGVDARFAPEPQPDEVDELLSARYGLSQDPWIFCPGAVREKKNLAALLRGAAALARRRPGRFQVVVSGAHTPDLRRDLGLASQLGLAGRVSTPGSIEDAHLPGVYRMASAVAVLSRSEGFCFPVLEALACGTPVLVPHDSAQAELAGAAATCVDPEDPESVAAGIERARTERESGRAARIERARAFTWGRCALNLEQLWKELA